ncbi:MAG TPA: M23 family metallopeptidase [Candidatus Sumerlaeota bacterium]|nr:M23 family metallopeptidase [Candidatus Sumerlaeota bacterium]
MYGLIHLFSAGFLFSSLFRLIRAVRKKGYRTEPSVDVTGTAPAFLMLLSAVVMCIAIIYGARLFLAGRLWNSIRMLSLVLIVSAVLDAFSQRLSPALRKRRKAPLVASVAAVVTACAALIFVLHLRSAPPPTHPRIHLSYPVKGEWLVITGGKHAMLNYHHGNPPSQNYAVDLILERGDCTGEIIYSPVDGVVAEAFHDRDVGSPEPEGNLLIIETVDGISIWLAHLQKDSLLVGRGDRVTAGQPIAKCGATGGADLPHLHIHAEMGNAPVAMLFGGGKRFLVRNDILHVR